MSHNVSAAEAQHQYDDGEYHGCSVGSVLNILLRGAQLEEHAQWEGGCLLVQSMRDMVGESCRKHHSGTIADGFYSRGTQTVGRIEYLLRNRLRHFVHRTDEYRNDEQGGDENTSAQRCPDAQPNHHRKGKGAIYDARNSEEGIISQTGDVSEF